MLVHICCSVDSHYFLQKLKKLYPDTKITGFFYNPNIHPYEEFLLRFIDVKRSCDTLGIELILGDYDDEEWLAKTYILKDEPEKGKRCEVCFDYRLEKTALLAQKLKINTITTTLLTSPKKSFLMLEKSANDIKKAFNLNFITPDFRKQGGTQEQFLLAKKDKLYHQNYCGCIYALQKQRMQQNKIQDELFLPISQQIQPNSILYRIKLYKKIAKLVKNKQNFEIKRQKILNYRLFNAKVSLGTKTIPSYIIFYSKLKNEKVKVDLKQNISFHETNKENIIFISLSFFNQFTKKKYNSVNELNKMPPKLKVELKVRKYFNDMFYSTNPIIVLDNLFDCKLEITLKSVFYEDIIENLALV